MQGEIRFEEGPAGWLAHSNLYRLAAQGKTREEAQRNLEHLEETMAGLKSARIKAQTDALSKRE